MVWSSKKKKTPSPSSVFLAREYLLTTTLHGARYIASSETVLGRVVWALLTTASLSFCVYIVLDNVQTWREQPVVTTVLSVPVVETDFPAVTVCPGSFEVVFKKNSIYLHTVYCSTKQ